MLSVFSTRDYEPRERLDFWNELVSSTYEGICIDRVNEDFNASLSVWQTEALRIVRPRSGPCLIARHASGNAHRTQRTFKMHLLTEGEIELEQRGRRTIGRAGDILICAAEEFYRINAITAHEMMVVEFDGNAALDRLPDFEDHIARTISGELPGSRIIRRYMNSLWQEGREGLSPELGKVHASILLEMTVACLADQTGISRPLADPVSARIEEAISVRLEDTALRPSILAADLGIPLRTLQDAAARAGTTLNQMILRQRLQRATTMLRKKSNANIADIALACGFSDPSYFARRFAQFHGVSPSQYQSCN